MTDYRHEILFYVVVSQTGAIHCSNPNLANCFRTGNHIVCEFENGFVIPIWNFNVKRYDNRFSHVTFSLFGRDEAFTFVGAFRLNIGIWDYTDDHVSGIIRVTQQMSDGVVHSDMSEFRLDWGGSLWKREESNEVYDRVRFLKELLIWRSRG